jgi:uncharacterized SAM-binding protein YcdF (DUF218 family)
LIAAVRSLHPFLAVSDPHPGGALTVEGWVQDRTMREAIAEFNRGHYTMLYVTGGPLERGALLSEYHTTAELGTASLLRMGMPKEFVQVVPTPLVRRDRTYASAIALKRWLDAHQIAPSNLTVVAPGPHARRTRLLFQKAFGNATQVGVFAAKDLDYDPQEWWMSSNGFRAETDEAIAYVYARMLFDPEVELN